MNSSEQPRLATLALGEDSTEELLVTPVGPNLYRMEESSVFGEARYRDIIEAEPQAEGILRLLRIVSRSGLKVICWIVREDLLETPSVSALLDRVVAVGGNWERTFGGVLMLHLPPGEESSIVTEFRGVLGINH